MSLTEFAIAHPAVAASLAVLAAMLAVLSVRSLVRLGHLRSAGTGAVVAAAAAKQPGTKKAGDRSAIAGRT